MEQPSPADYQRAIEFVADLHCAPDAATCHKRFTSGIATLVGCDVTSFNIVRNTEIVSAHYPLHIEFHGKLGLHYELLVVLRMGAEIITISLERATRDFDERDRALVHLAGTYLLRSLEHIANRRRSDDAAYVLTRREIQILERIAGGETNRPIARALGISPRTVQTHLTNAFEKLGTRTRAEAVARLIAARGSASGDATDVLAIAAGSAAIWLFGG
jgi:DNA-binding CsgD family transcriptional regulator